MNQRAENLGNGADSARVVAIVDDIDILCGGSEAASQSEKSWENTKWLQRCEVVAFPESGIHVSVCRVEAKCTRIGGIDYIFRTIKLSYLISCTVCTTVSMAASTMQASS